MSSEGDLVPPGSPYRVKVMVLGSSMCGKTTLVQSLMEGASFSSSSSSTSSSSSSSSSSPPRVDCRPTEGVSVRLWTPFVSRGAENPLGRELRGDEQHLVLEVWDTCGRHVCQPVHGLFLTAKTLCVIVYDVTDSKATETVLNTFRMVRQKFLESAVVVVGTKADLAEPRGDHAAKTLHEVLQAVERHDQAYRETVAGEIEGLKALLKETQTTRVPDNRKQQNAQKAAHHPSAVPARDTPLHQHLTSLEARLARAVNGHPSALRCVLVSGSSGKGIEDLRRIVLEAALDAASFPHSSTSSSMRQSAVSLYDRILALRDLDVVMLPWRQFVEVAADGGEEATLEEDVASLSDVGGLMEFRADTVRFPTPSTHPQGTEKEQEEKEEKEEKGKSGKSDTAGVAPSMVSAATVSTTEGRYVCVHPALFATAICLCLVDDDKKSFRFEAGRFWPRDSGFKHPDPQVLCKVLEAIPQQGLLRECLLPLLWQDYPLSEAQVGHMLQVLQGEGLLAEVCQQKRHCEGLALPRFPRLSVLRCHALPLLSPSLLPDNRPQLNWTPKPFVGDIQVTWSFHVHAAHTGLLQRLLAVVLFLSRDCSSYRHLWRHGVLVRVGEATLCAEMLESEERVAVSCRVNADELGRERDAVRLLWVILTPFLFRLRHFLLRWPGLVLKERLRALGQQFYQAGEEEEEEKKEEEEGEKEAKVREEPEVEVSAALSLWQRRTCWSFVAEDRERRLLDIALLFPFQPDPAVLSADGWLRLVMSKSDVILSGVDVIVTSPVPRPSREKSFKRLSMRSSVRHQRKKKSVEIKWQLQEEPNNNNSGDDHDDDKTQAAGSSDPSSSSERQGARDSQPEDQAPARQVTVQELEAEAVRLASGFVAAILASAVADYVAEEAGGGQYGRKQVSAAQTTAARLTADAAMAVLSGDIEGAANAVIDAVKAVKGNNSPGHKTEMKKRKGSVRSKLCVIA
ncbi:uncharacterized protein LOC143285020 [Babylonia areolata]|uniref:uncharacterized protein LOC143285020 n=1 Tax=Babylonia areolata TaxID=304850 RepID=UPI003FD5514F